MTQAKCKAWWDEENKIGRMKIEGNPDEKMANELFDKLDGINSKMPGKTNWLVDPGNNRPSSRLRKTIAERFYANPKMEKQAVLTTSTVIKVIMQFAMKASGRKNVRAFANEEEALKWLKRGE